MALVLFPNTKFTSPPYAYYRNKNYNSGTIFRPRFVKIRHFILKMWSWRKLEKIIWNDGVRNEVLHRVNDGRNIQHTINRKRVNWIGHNWRTNCLLKYVTEGNIEGKIKAMGRRWIRCKLLLDTLRKRQYNENCYSRIQKYGPGFIQAHYRYTARTMWQTIGMVPKVAT